MANESVEYPLLPSGVSEKPDKGFSFADILDIRFSVTGGQPPCSPQDHRCLGTVGHLGSLWCTSRPRCRSMISGRIGRINDTLLTDQAFLGRGWPSGQTAAKITRCPSAPAATDGSHYSSQCGCSERYCAPCILCERHYGCGDHAPQPMSQLSSLLIVVTPQLPGGHAFACATT